MNDRNILLAGVGSRVAVVLLGCILPTLPLVPKVNKSFALENLSGVPRSISPWYRWDANWYARISREGYSDYGRPGKTSIAFLPLLPMVMSAGASVGLDRFWVGLLVPNIAFVVGLVFFARIAYILTGTEAAAWRSCLLLMAYPWSFYFSAPYQESLGFALATGAALAWATDRPFASGLAAALAQLSRPSCLSVPVSIAGEWVINKFRGRPTRWYAPPVAVAGLLGLVGFMAFCYFRFGDPMAYSHAHDAWDRKSMGPGPLLEALLHPPRSTELLKDYIAIVGFLAIGLVTLRNRGVFWGGLVLMPPLLGLASGTVTSGTRIVLLCFPGFIEAADFLRNRYAFGTVAGLGFLLQLLMLKGFVS